MIVTLFTTSLTPDNNHKLLVYVIGSNRHQDSNSARFIGKIDAFALHSG